VRTLVDPPSPFFSVCAAAGLWLSSWSEAAVLSTIKDDEESLLFVW
jgi:hypothetical protein